MKTSEIAVRKSLINDPWIIQKSIDFTIIFNKLNWQWVTSKSSDKVPSFDEVRKTIVDLIITMKNNKEVTALGTGGIMVEKIGDNLYVSLVADEFEVP